MASVYVLHLGSSPEDIRYVGITKYDDATKRLASHRDAVLRGKVTPVYSWMRKHLDDVEATVVLSNITWEEACAEERRLIAAYRSFSDNLLNLTNGGEGLHGYVYTAKDRQKMSETHKGTRHSSETRKKMSEANKGKTLSLETRKKLSEANKGKIASDETRKKMSESQKGRKHSPEACKKMSEAQKGRIFSEETRKKISESQKARLKSKPQKGRVTSDETRKKISEAQKKRWKA